MVYTFESEIVKISTNAIYSGTHWDRRRDFKDCFLVLIKKCRLNFRIAKPCDINFEFFFKGKLLDCSNCSFMGKMIEDALVKVGVLLYDSPGWVTSVKYSSKKGKEDSVRVTITTNENVSTPVVKKKKKETPVSMIQDLEELYEAKKECER